MIPKYIGPYRIESEIGGNERGTVYRATDPQTDRQIALKLLRSQYLYTMTSEKKFFEGAEKLRSVNHPAIVPILDFGDEDNRPFLTMPLLEGGNLTPRLAASLPLDETVRIFSPIADALDTVAAQGIYHADLKPNNVLFNTQSEPMVADLGLLQIIESLSFAKSMFSNEHYISPEQVRRRPLTAETQVYSLAAMIYHALTGRPLFSGATERVTSFKHVSEKPIHPQNLNPQVSKETGEVLLKALAKKPEMRYQTCRELLSQLQKTQAGNLTVKEIREERQRTGVRDSFPGRSQPPAGIVPNRPAIQYTGNGSPRAFILSVVAFTFVCVMALGILVAFLLLTSFSP